MKSDHTSVLCMSDQPKSRQTVRRHYMAWRMKQGIPTRCDKPSCQFFTIALRWNGQPLPLILDHESGNARDNRPDNLRFLCPNCDSQNSNTRGGANAGRIGILPGGSYHVRHRNGTQDAYANGAAMGVQAIGQVGTVTAVVSYPDQVHDETAGDA